MNNLLPDYMVYTPVRSMRDEEDDLYMFLETIVNIYNVGPFVYRNTVFRFMNRLDRLQSLGHELDGYHFTQDDWIRIRKALFEKWRQHREWDIFVPSRLHE